MNLDNLRDDFPEMPVEIRQMIADEVEGQMKGKIGIKKRNRRLSQGTIAAAIAVAVLCIGGTTFAAIKWSRGLSNEMHLTSEQKIMLEETGMVTHVNQSVPVETESASDGEGIPTEEVQSFVSQSDTEGNVTITANECIVDNYFALISFTVDGFTLEDGLEPCFDTIDVKVDGKSSGEVEDILFSSSGSFYNGIITDENGNPVHEDGTPLSEDDFERYLKEDGSYEYILSLHADQKGYFMNKPIEITISGLGSVYKAEYTELLSATWNFSWETGGSSASREVELAAELGDSGADVIYAEISPISLYVKYDFPKKEETVKALDEAGNEADTVVFADPPELTGVRMKDGTMYPFLYMGPGSQGYEDEEGKEYYKRFLMDRVLDVNEIESLLFIKSYPNGEGGFTADNFYIVPLQ